MTSNANTFGEYLHRLRREKKWNLHELAERSGLSYFHLSRMENDSTVPSAGSVAKLAEALEADVKPLLELANCLPRTILDRLVSQQIGASGPVLNRRAFGPGPTTEEGADLTALGNLLQRVKGLDIAEARGLAAAALALAELRPDQREAILSLIQTLKQEGPEDYG